MPGCKNQQIIVVSAGNGHFDVEPGLARLTKRRLMDGIGCDVVCLRPRPLHAVPFFRLFHSDGHVSYSIPSWFYVCFVDASGSRNPPLSCHVRDLQLKRPLLQDRALIPCDDATQVRPEGVLFFVSLHSHHHAPPQRLPPAPFEATNEVDCNPFSLDYAQRAAKQTASGRRWINAFFKSEATAAATSDAANPNYVGLLAGINWESITEPASLPLSTDYFPPDSALAARFTVHPYIMSLIPLENAYDDNPRLLMRELVYQRLVHGYQIVMSRTRMFTQEEAADKHGLIASVVYLSMAQDFQIISYDPLVSADNVDVKIFHKNDTDLGAKVEERTLSVCSTH